MEITRPKVFVVSAPSGAGKTTIIHQAIARNPNIFLSVSHTSRVPRKSEREGLDYYFVSAEVFRQKISRNEFLEWAEVHGNYYGTSLAEIKKLIAEGKVVILDIDVQGAQQVRKKHEIDPVYIFIEPPSLEELKRRLYERDSETEESLQKRIENAEREMQFKDEYDYVIMNDQLEKAVVEFSDIINRHAVLSRSES